MSMRVEKRAWWMVAWLSVAGMVSVNSLVLTPPFSVLLKPIGAEFGWSRTQTSSLVSIMALLSALILPGVGKLLDVYGTRRIVVPAAALVSGILVVMAFLPNIYVLWLAVLAVMGLAVASLSGMPVGRLGARWVDAKRGLATGIIGTGGAIGIAISPPLLVGAITASAGWRTAFIALAIATLVIHLLPMAFIVRDPTPPAEDRALGHHAHGQTNELPGLSIKECLRTRHLWVMLVSTAIIGCAVPGGALIHLVAMLTDKGGIEPAKAIAAVSFMAIATVAGRLVGGYLLDRVYAPPWSLSLPSSSRSLDSSCLRWDPVHSRWWARCFLDSRWGASPTSSATSRLATSA